MAQQLYVCQNTNFHITLDLTRDSLFNNAGLLELKNKHYQKDNEPTPQHSLARAACAFADNQEHAQRLYDYASKHWFMFASPLLANGGTKAGMPISCFLSKVEDTVDDLLAKTVENGYLAVYGGGTGSDWSSVRSKGSPVSRGGTTPGIIPFIKVFDSMQSAYMQGSTRRGSTAVYLDVSHPEIMEFIEIRDPVGTSDQQRRCLSIGFHNAINIPDSFMEAVINDLDWQLIDPTTKKVTDTHKARDIWKKILKTRIETGEPYLHFIDTSNRSLNECLKNKGLRINSSNLCNEIYLPTTEDRTAVCCLSSVNIEKYDEWGRESEIHDTFLEDLFRMLDNVLTYFIKFAPKEVWRARESANRERSVGLGAMGFHSYLQKHSVPFESNKARDINMSIFSKIKITSHKINKILGKERGSPRDLEGSGDRFAHMLAIAPNATSSIICGNTSPSIEPMSANAYVQDTLAGSTTNKNKYLQALLSSKNRDNKEVWNNIFVHKGSVQHLNFLTEQEKLVFKTAIELDQEWVIRHAADRQQYICQGQSVNLFFYPNVKYSDLHRLHKMAWEKGLKGLYYCRSESMSQVSSPTLSVPSAEETSGITTKRPLSVSCQSDDVCVVCQG